MDLWIKIGAIAGALMPLFNIPLIIHMIKRKSADDISLLWTVGVWACIILMTPAALCSKDAAFKVFGVTNVIFFSLFASLVFKYRLRKKNIK
jgi:uncharacterized protein with PQ loop repeat